jgi:hypothetical protein
MVDDECDDLFQEYKADEEFDASDVMDTPLRKAMNLLNKSSLVILLPDLADTFILNLKLASLSLVNLTLLGAYRCPANKIQ